jgi:uncharacterized protein with von Willebrand factor type A (vWA) domain
MTKILSILVDSSGSMIDMNPKETVQSLNKNIQKIANDDTNIFVARFSDEYELFIKNKKKNEVNIKEQDISPDGLTALYDGINFICKDISEEYGNSANNNTTIIILTDGAENSSQHTGIQDIRKLLSQKQENGWKFVFLGANQDAITTGKNLGINKDSCCTYSATPGGLQSALRCTSEAIERSAISNEYVEFTQEERNESLN